MTIEHAAITDPEIHEPKGISTALDGQVYVCNGSGSGTWMSQQALPSTVVYVETVDDFPTAVSDVITLDAGTLYQINKIVDVGANRFIVSEDSILIGVHRELAGITSSTTGALFSATGVDFRIQSLTLDAPSCSDLYTFDGSNTKTMSVVDIKSLTHTGDIGTSANSLATIIEFSVYFGGVNGFSFTGATHGPVVINQMSLVGFTGTGLDLGTAVISGGRLSESAVSGTGGADIGISGLASSGNVASGSKFYVEQNNFNGTTTPLDTVQSQDVQWVFLNNTSIENTHREAQIYAKGITGVTSIASANTPVKIEDDSLFTEAHAEQFSTTSDGRITYDGVDDDDFMVTATLTGTCSSGTRDFTVYIAKNGTVLPEISSTREFVASVIDSTTVIGIVELSTSDYLEMWVENDSDSNDFEAKDINIVVMRS